MSGSQRRKKGSLFQFVLNISQALTKYQNSKIRVKFQYENQTVGDIEKVLKEDPMVKLVHDGLSVRVSICDNQQC